MNESKVNKALLTCTLQLEQQCIDEGHVLVAGLDEVGRGCLFGPVVVAAVVFPPNLSESSLPKCRDSKKLSQKQRERLYKEIQNSAADISVEFGHADEIDQYNILHTTLCCFSRAVINLQNTKPTICLIDGNQKPTPTKHSWPENIRTRTIVKGDSISLSIAAASIIAKVTRDRWIIDLVQRTPKLKPYCFDCNMGYPSLAHRKALTQYGPTEWHRRSYKWTPVPNIIKSTDSNNN